MESTETPLLGTTHPRGINGLSRPGRNRGRRIAAVALAALVSAPSLAPASDAPPSWPAIITLADDDGTVKLESWFSVDRVVDCPDAPNPAPLTAAEAGGGTMTLHFDPGVGPPLVLRYGARFWTERSWPELEPALLLVAWVGEDGARWDGGFAAGAEDCVEWRR